VIDLRRILVPTDFGEHSRNALNYGAALADKFRAALTLLHVLPYDVLVPPDPMLAAPVPVPPPVGQEDDARAALDRLRADPKLDGLDVATEVVRGDPAEEIVRYARQREIDLIVLGTHGHTGLAHLLTGSTAERVVRRAPCPVLTVHHPEHEFVVPDEGEGGDV
jgi:nucleotide-binding universal stress UspA family protein